MKVYYIEHSTFLVESETKYLLFDYFDHSVIPEIGYEGKLPILDDNKPLYVFASHGHKDHWSLEALRWAEDRDNIHYILAKHIRLGANYLKRNGIDSEIKQKITFVSAGNEYKVDDMVITTLRSNDEGVAYLIHTDGVNIYHAGDLNWWGSTIGQGELYTNTYGMSYKRELKALKDKVIDLAFVVLDPRLGEECYYLGMEYFLQNIECDLVFPMHLWKQYEYIDRLKRRPGLNGLSEKVVEIDRENILFNLD